MRAAAELAASPDGPVKGERLAEAQDIPLQFLEHILLDLKHAGIGLGLLIWFPRWWNDRRAAREALEAKTAARDRSDDLAPETIG